MYDNRSQEEVTENSAQDLSAERQQAENAAGENGNDQGQASFITGATTGGGSNYGQGSSHLSGGSYQQGDKANAGANYSNETGKFGSSSTGTSNEGSSSKNTGASATGSADDTATSAGKSARENDQASSPDEDRGMSDGGARDLEERDRRNTGLEQDSGLAADDTTEAARRASGSWSAGSINEGH